MTEADYGPEALGPRLEAEKIAELKESGRSRKQPPKRRFGWRKRRVIGVVLNTVAGARAVFEELNAKGEAILLTGRIRPFDRDVLLRNFLDRMQRSAPVSGKTLFVAATQTVEVGADLDFDALVTEAAAMDSCGSDSGD